LFDKNRYIKSLNHIIYIIIVIMLRVNLETY